MSDITLLSILDDRGPQRGWDFNERLFAALLLLVIGLPALLSALVILLMVLSDGPK